MSARRKCVGGLEMIHWVGFDSLADKRVKYRHYVVIKKQNEPMEMARTRYCNEKNIQEIFE
jgi:hypothetical protein